MLSELMAQLEALGTERTKKAYLSQGAKEPVFGVTTGAMKPFVKQHKNDQALAEALYATGNYDAMYLAGMIADPKQMGPSDFERWMAGAYFPNIGNFIVSVTLAESECAEAVAEAFIQSGDSLKMAAGWSCFEWLLGWKKDEKLSHSQIEGLLARLLEDYSDSPEVVQKAMRGFVTAVAISYAPLSADAISAAKKINPSPLEKIQKELAKGRLGFKRKHVRC